MKKLLFFLLFLLPFSVFAWEDTDRICQDTTKYGRLNWENISVNYPWEKVTIYDTIWKLWWPYDTPFVRLYYVVSIEDWNYYSRSELYMYNCYTKKPTLLAKLPVWKNLETYSIGYAWISQVVLVQYARNAMIPPLQNMIGINVTTKKRLFTLTNIDKYFRFGWSIEGFAEWADAWYMTINHGYDIVEAFRIDKKTRQFTRL